MTNAEIQAIYAELATISTRIVQNPQLGFSHYADQIAKNRVNQDRLGELTIKVNRETARLRVATRALKEIVRLGGSLEGDRTREQLEGLANETDDLKMLADSLAVKTTLVRLLTSDIRLNLKVMEMQIQLGEVTPNRDPKAQNSGPDTLESAKMVERFLDSGTRQTH